MGIPTRIAAASLALVLMASAPALADVRIDRVVSSVDSTDSTSLLSSSTLAAIVRSILEALSGY